MADEDIRVKLILQNARKFISEIKKAAIALTGLGTSTDKAANRMSRASRLSGMLSGRIDKVRRAARFAGFAIAGSFALGVRKAVGEIMESNAVLADQRQALKTTGHAAGVNGKQLQSRADALSRMTAVDDEAIAKSQTMLLTFTKIQNKVGKGNKIFDQASVAVLDYSRRFGKDLTSSSIAVGKALNDPVRGITALRKVGVSFTDSQQKQIKSLVESGQTLKAQKMILRELKVETGGAAAAYGKTLPGAVDRAKIMVDNLAESAGGFLAPAIIATVNGVEKAVGWFREATAQGGALWPIVGRLGIVWDNVKLALDAFGKAFSTAMGQSKNGEGAISSFAGVVGGLLVQFSMFAIRIAPQAGFWFGKLVGFFRDNKIAIYALIGAVAAFVAPWATAIAAVIFLYQRFPIFRKAVNALVAWLVKTFVPMFKAVWADLKLTIAQWILWGTQIWSKYGADIIAFVKKWGPQVLTWLTAPIKTAWNIVRAVLAVLRGDWGAAWRHIRGAAAAAWAGLKAMFKVQGKVLQLIFKAAWWVLKTLAKKAWDGVKKAVSAGAKWVGDKISGMKSTVKSKAAGMFDGVKDAFKSAINWVIGKWNNLSFTLPKISLPERLGGGTVGGQSFSTPDIPTLGFGGTVREGQRAIVGERGDPEQLEVRGGKAIVTPMTRVSSADVTGIDYGRMFGGGGTTVLHDEITLEMDGKKVGSAMAKRTLDDMARR